MCYSVSFTSKGWLLYDPIAIFLLWQFTWDAIKIAHCLQLITKPELGVRLENYSRQLPVSYTSFLPLLADQVSNLAAPYTSSILASCS